MGFESIGDANNMKHSIFLLFSILFIIGFSACCLGMENKTVSQPSHIINNSTYDSSSDERISGINVSTVPYLGSESILTNASFVAQIALSDKNVEKMLFHGGDIKGIIDFMPSRPKEWNMSVGPTLWIVCRGIDVYFYVNETGQFVERHEIVIPGYLYRKERLENYTCLIDKNGTAVFIFNSSDIWFPEDTTCS